MKRDCLVVPMSVNAGARKRISRRRASGSARVSGGSLPVARKRRDRLGSELQNLAVSSFDRRFGFGKAVRLGGRNRRCSKRPAYPAEPACTLPPER
jgi:hypothetical protein